MVHDCLTFSGPWGPCLAGSGLAYSSNIVGCIQRSYSTLRRVSNEMGDHSQVYRLRIQPSHPGQLSLAIPQWVGKMSRLLRPSLGKKRRVLS